MNKDMTMDNLTNKTTSHGLTAFGANVPLTMSSREIAELTGITHDNVLKTVRSLIDRGVVSKNETPYTHPQNGQTYSEFRLNYRDTMVVVSGYSVELRARIIDRWQELEAKGGHAPCPGMPAYRKADLKGQPGTPGGVLLDVPGLNPKLEDDPSEVDSGMSSTAGRQSRSPSEERELVARILAGDRQLFHELVRPDQCSVYFAAYSILDNEHDAEDVAQETVLKALKDLGLLLSGRSQVRHLAGLHRHQ